MDYSVVTEFWPTDNATDNTTDGSNATECCDLEMCIQMANNLPSTIHASFGTSVLLVVLLSFLTKRKYRWTHCCGGRPGVVVPLNLLDSPTNRWAYACAFGSISNVILIFFIGGSQFFASTALWVRVSASLLGALEICVCFLPFFACLETDSTILAPFIGMLYSAGWLLLIGVYTIVCRNPLPEQVPYIGLVLELPTVLCILFLTVNFVRLWLRGLNEHQRHIETERKEPSIAFPVQQAYVRDLLAGDIQIEEKTTKAGCCAFVMYKVKSFVAKYIYVKKKNFMFSTRMICTMAVGTLCVYQLFVIIYAGRETLMYALSQGIEDREVIKATIVMIRIVTWISFILMVIQIIFILGKYRYDILLLYRGDRSCLPRTYNPNSATIVRMGMLFSGYQIAYMMWGFLILSVGLFIFALLFCVLIIAPAIYGQWQFVWAWVEPLFIPFAMSMILRAVQLLLARFAFLLPKVNDEDDDKPLAITNRRLYDWVNYFFFLANIAIGLFSCLYRIGIGMLFGLLFLGRLDRPVLMTGFESLDTGHMAYLGMLMLEYAHNHPVLRVFCHLLVTERRKHQEKTSSKATIVPVAQFEQELGEFPTRNNRSVRARTRWHLAYTLINNPQLGHLRRRGEAEDEEEKKSFMLLVAQHKVFLKLRHKFKSIEKWAAELEESYYGSESGAADDADNQNAPLRERISRDFDDDDESDDQDTLLQERTQLSHDLDQNASRDSQGRVSRDIDADEDTGVSRDITGIRQDRTVSCLVERKPNGSVDETSTLEVIASFGERAILEQVKSNINKNHDINTQRPLNMGTNEINCTGEFIGNSNVSVVHL